MKRQKGSGQGEAGSSRKSQAYSSPSSSSRHSNRQTEEEKQTKQKQDSITNTATDTDRSVDDNVGSPPQSPSPANPNSQSPMVSGPSRICHLMLGQSTGGPPLPPSYGFHNLERRTIVLADGSVRSYFALPLDSPLDPYGPAASHRRPGLGLSPPPPPPPLGVRPATRYDDRQHLQLSHIPPHYPHPIHTIDGAGRLSPRNFREQLPPYGREGGHHHESWSSLGIDGVSYLMKRKHGGGEEEEYARHRQQVLQYSRENPNASFDRLDNIGRSTGSPLLRNIVDTRPLPKHLKLERSPSFSDRQPHVDSEVLPPDASDVDPQALKSAFLRFSKSINESKSVKKNYLEDGRNTRLTCLACGRSSKEFADMHGLIMHTYHSQQTDLRVDHLGLHKALCVLMGWNFAKTPDDSKAYQVLSANDAASNKEDLIMWPPTVIIHNTKTGRRKDGRPEGISNKEMDRKLKEFGFSSGKAKAVYGKEGHLGTTIVKFTNTQIGLRDAEELAAFFEKDGHGRRGWAHAEACQIGIHDDANPTLFKVDEKTGEKKRIFFGYLATASDLEKVDYEVRKKADIKSKRDFDSSN